MGVELPREVAVELRHQAEVTMAEVTMAGATMAGATMAGATTADTTTADTTTDPMAITAEACGSEPGGDGDHGGGVPAIHTITRITTLITRIMPHRQSQPSSRLNIYSGARKARDRITGISAKSPRDTIRT